MLCANDDPEVLVLLIGGGGKRGPAGAGLRVTFRLRKRASAKACVCVSKRLRKRASAQACVCVSVQHRKRVLGVAKRPREISSAQPRRQNSIFFRKNE